MKFQSILILSLSLILVSCGKDSNSSGKSSKKQEPVKTTETKTDQVVDNMNTTGTNAYSKVLSWYQSKTENSTPVGPVLEQRLIESFSKSNCKDTTILGFINLQTCFGSSSTSAEYVYKQVVASSSTDKSTNTNLYLVFNPASNMGLQGVTESSGPFGKPLYQVDYVKTNGHVIRYKIDTGLNSAFNPVEIYDSELGTRESVVNATQLK